MHLDRTPSLPTRRSRSWRRAIGLAVVLVSLTAIGAKPKTEAQKEAEAAEIAAYAAARKSFDAKLARVDRALVKNPGRVHQPVVESCRSRRMLAARLFDIGQHARAERRLDFCIQTMRIPEPKQQQAAAEGPSLGARQAEAARELEAALPLQPDLAHGLEIWRECAGCHLAEGWGLPNGSVPQLAGQHRTVVLKQLADIRSGSRENSLMMPYAAIERIGGAQSLADVAGYIDTLEISVDTEKGTGDALPRGEQLYREHCTSCHGARGEGNAEAFVPRIQSQHYTYLARQFESIREGTRENAHPHMKELIQDFDDADTHAVLDYVSRLEPPEELQAPPGWSNPDFAR